MSSRDGIGGGGSLGGGGGRSSRSSSSTRTRTGGVGGNGDSMMKRAVSCLHPVKPSVVKTQERKRFSQLLLDHGERHMQDWAVVASSSPCSMPVSSVNTSSSSSPGKRGTLSRSGSSGAHLGGGGGYIDRSPSSFDSSSHHGGGGGGGAPPPSSCMGRIEGRLRLCSNSVVFEPDDWSRGIIRCPLSRMSDPPISMEAANANFGAPGVSTSSSSSSAANSQEEDEGGAAAAVGGVAVLRCDRHLVMKTMNVIGPFESVEVPTVFRFAFVHSSPAAFLRMSQNLFRSKKKGAGGGGGGSVSGATSSSIEDMLRPMIDRPFDASNLVDVREKPLTSNLRCSLLLPLLSNPGCALATEGRLYFQPAGGGVVAGAVSSKATCWKYEDVAGYARRYSGLRDSAVELFLRDGTSVLLAFESREDRERVVRLLPSSADVPCHTDREFVVRAVIEWQRGTISNFDYLLALNSAAGRTFHDLSRYPVFPWVIADYKSSRLDLKSEKTFRDLSKPVGALDDERLEYFTNRFLGMQDMDNPFLYGTHYSAPGYVLYYLVRSMPEHMLCLQNGKFDSPDRMFHSLDQCYSSVLTNHADVKELIPEFYDPNSGFDFLINARNLKLGVTQNGDRVDDVRLPPWARSARDYVKKNRKALESDYCTERLPRWIDLIFGIDSRGENARRASNLFHEMAYLGPADLERMATDEERAQAELQATEFGIVPDQLFSSRHPRRDETVNLDEMVCPDSGRGNVYLDGEDDGGMDDGKSGRRNGDRKPRGSHANDQPWELLDSPSKSMQSIDDDDSSGQNRDRGWSADSFRDRVWSTDSANDIAGKVAAVVSPNPSQTKKTLGGRMMNSPYSERSSDADPRNDDKNRDLVTPRGKAKSSWLSNFSVSKGSVNEAGTPNDAGNAAANGDPKASVLEFGETAEKPLTAGSSSTQTQGVVDGGHTSQTPMSKMLALSNVGDSGRQLLSGMEPKKLLSRARSNGSAMSEENRPFDQSQHGWRLKLLASKAAHGDTVSACALSLPSQPGENSYLVTVSLDGNMVVHLIESQNGTDQPTSVGSKSSTLRMLSRSRSTGRGPSTWSTKLHAYRSHSSADPLACLAMTKDTHGGNIVFAGGHDDVVLAYGINSACALASVYSHRDAVTGLDFIQRSSDATTSLQSSTHLMVSGSWDATVKVWSVTVAAGETVSINREPLAELFDADASVVCVASTELTPTNEIAICAGCSDGSLVVWRYGDNGVKEMLHKERAARGSGPCSAVKWGPRMLDRANATLAGACVLFAGFANGKVGSFVLKGRTMTPLSEVTLASPVRCISINQGVLVAGCADGGLRVIPVEKDAIFDSSPRVWGSINGKSSPGLGCVSLAQTESKSSFNRQLCAIGADDGSVSLYELTQTEE